MNTCAPATSLLIWSVPMAGVDAGSAAGAASFGATGRRVDRAGAEGARSRRASGAGVVVDDGSVGGTARVAGDTAGATDATGGLELDRDHPINAPATATTNPSMTTSARRFMRRILAESPPASQGERDSAKYDDRRNNQADREALAQKCHAANG